MSRLPCVDALLLKDDVDAVLRQVMLTVNRLISLPFRLSREQRSWLEKMRKDKREDVRNTAEWAWEMRFPPRAQPEDEIDMDPDDLP